MESGESAWFGLRERIRGAAEEIGFSRCGIAARGETEAASRLRRWLDLGFHGRMGWIARDPDGRCDPDRVLPGLRSVVCVALRYGRPEPVPAVPGRPRISRYAWGRDYHAVMETKLRQLEERIRSEWDELRASGSGAASGATGRGSRSERPGFAARESPKTGLPAELRMRRACDTSPVMDKVWAAAGGIGWLGKNACVIHPREGSWIFLGEIFTNLPMPPDPPLPDRCGDCRRCLEACPTGALVAPYLLDARRCISYLTIEHRGEFDAWEAAAIEDWIVGCDICQDVCPWNRRAPHSDDPSFAPDPRLVEPKTQDWSAMEDGPYRQRVRGTAIERVRPGMMRRNARQAREWSERRGPRTRPETDATEGPPAEPRPG